MHFYKSKLLKYHTQCEFGVESLGVMSFEL
jgi:hypothetical protein